MKIKLSIVFSFLLFGLITYVFAMAGDLTEPDLAFSKEFDEVMRSNIVASLRRPVCKFLGGHFINWNTSLEYGGDTKALNLLLSGIAKCPGFTLSMRFYTGTEIARNGTDWLVTHDALMPDQLVVRVNLKSSKIKLEDLVIPDAKGPNLPEKR